MAFESLVALLQTPLVHAKPDVVHVNPDGRNKRENHGREPRKACSAAGHPVANTQGQITGKLIDTTA